MPQRPNRPSRSASSHTAGQGTSRRRFLAGLGSGFGALAGGGLAGGGLARAGLVSPHASATLATPAHRSIGITDTGARPKNIIYLIADGMSAGAPSICDPFTKLIRGQDSSSTFARMLTDRNVVQSLRSTASANSLVTDSAAAASAMGCGHRVNNASLNVLPDGSHGPLLTARLRENLGMGTGVVVTDSICGATPSGFCVHAQDRGQAQTIAEQYAQGPVDVMMGGGREWFEHKQGRIGDADYFAQLRDLGYDVITHGDQCRTSGGPKVAGIYDNGTLGFHIDRIQDPSVMRRIPTLAEMTTRALQALTQNENGFFLMVEAAHVDKAAHVQDGAAVMWEMMLFDDALATCLDFARENGETLVVATSDHGNGNPGLTGLGRMYADAEDNLVHLTRARSSFSNMRRLLESAAEHGNDAVRDVVNDRLGVELDDREIEIIRSYCDSDLPDADEISRYERSWNGTLSQAIGNHTGFGFTCGDHTADHVLLTATGPGSDAFRGLHHHTDAHDRMIDLLGA